MSILINENTRILVQGITGREGLRSANEMRAYGAKVSCGVTPSKGGMVVDSFHVFDSVKEALEYDPKINASAIYVPPLMVLDAAMEAIDSGIKLIVIVTEGVPIRHAAILKRKASESNSVIIGPASVGIISPGKAKIGSIGGHNSDRMFRKGNIGIISKSGGMSAETALLLSQNGMGQSTVIGIGGEMIICSDYVSLIRMFEEDDETEAIVIYGEIGGGYEEELAKAVSSGKFQKPIIAYISGEFAEAISREINFGHTGAIIVNGKGTASQKKRLLGESGVLVADYHDDIPKLLRSIIRGK